MVSLICVEPHYVNISFPFSFHSPHFLSLLFAHSLVLGRYVALTANVFSIALCWVVNLWCFNFDAMFSNLKL